MADSIMREIQTVADELEAQKKTFRAEADQSGKPANIVEKIVDGKMEKYYAEVCLLRQPFVKDDKISVGELVTSVIAELKENIKVGRFARFELGESVSEDEEDWGSMMGRQGIRDLL